MNRSQADAEVKHKVKRQMDEMLALLKAQNDTIDELRDMIRAIVDMNM